MTKRILFGIIAMAVTVSTLSACNTVQGMGKDIQRGGQALEDAAE